jgi:lysosomal alpha-mannosidase
LHDDDFGVGEALNETAFEQGLVSRGRHYVMAGPINGVSPNLAAQERELANRKHLSPWLFFSPGGTSFEDWSANYKMEVRIQYTGRFFNTRTNLDVFNT